MEGLSREVSRHETQFVAPKATYEISVGHRPPRLDGTVDGARPPHYGYTVHLHELEP